MDITRLIKKARGLARRGLNFLEKIFRHIRWSIRTSRAKKSWLSPSEIVKYRQNIKIYDCFTFFNELDLLEIRLNILDPFVDYFVIVEANETFSGMPRQLCFKENRQRFQKWHHKIIYQEVMDVPKDEADIRNRLENNKNLGELDKEILTNALKTPTIGKDSEGKAIPTWIREFYIKECIKKSLTNLKDEDVCYISDLDEIWDPALVIDYSKDDVFKPLEVGYMYYLNNRSNEEAWTGWLGVIVTKYKNIRNVCLNELRAHRIMKSRYVFLRNGGWHFAFQGGLEGAGKKIKEYNHFWYSPEETLRNLSKHFSQNKDYRGGNIKLRKDERGLPQYILENREKYKKYFKNEL